MLKKWKELAKVDVSKYVEKRKDEKGNEFEYLPWVAVLRLLYENGAESVRMGINPSESGHTLHMTEGFTDKNGEVTHNPEVHVWVEIDGERYDYVYPVISGSYVVKDKTLNQQRIATAVVRAQCKCIAINTGLGISLWDKNDELDKPEIDVIELQNPKDLLAKFGGMVGDLVNNYGLTEAEIAAKMGLDTDRVGDVIKVEINHLRAYEKSLKKIYEEAKNM